MSLPHNQNLILLLIDFFSAESFVILIHTQWGKIRKKLRNFSLYISCNNTILKVEKIILFFYDIQNCCANFWNSSTLCMLDDFLQRVQVYFCVMSYCVQYCNVCTIVKDEIFSTNQDDAIFILLPQNIFFFFFCFVFLCVFIVMCWGNSKTQKPGEISYPNPKTDTQNPNWNPTTCKTRIKNHKIVTRLHCYFCNTYFTKKKTF